MENIIHKHFSLALPWFLREEDTWGERRREKEKEERGQQRERARACEGKREKETSHGF